MKFIKLLVFLLVFVACKKETPKQVTIKDDVMFLSNDSLEGRQTAVSYTHLTLPTSDLV